METKKTKYDTNPLDPDVERKADESWGGGAPTQQVGGATREVANESARKNVYSEAPTRRYDNPPLEQPYPSVFVPPTYAPPQHQYQQPLPPNAYYNPAANQATSRPVDPPPFAPAVRCARRAGDSCSCPDTRAPDPRRSLSVLPAPPPARLRAAAVP